MAASSVTTTVLAANAVNADKIAANAITAVKIAAGAVTATKVNLVPADVGAGSSGTSGARMNITSSTIKVFDVSGNLRVAFGDLTGI